MTRQVLSHLDLDVPAASVGLLLEAARREPMLARRAHDVLPVGPRHRRHAEELPVVAREAHGRLPVAGDARDEILNSYDDLIQIFDLEAPEGFSSMAAFNAELRIRADCLKPSGKGRCMYPTVEAKLSNLANQGLLGSSAVR